MGAAEDRLSALHPHQAWPAPSTTGEILRRAGLVKPRRRRYRTPPTLGGLTCAERPNHLWAVDHKGWVRLGDGKRCEPLTLTDSFSRFLIAVEACASTREALGQTPPAHHYQPSPRQLPGRLPEPDYPREADIRRVRSNDEIKWAGRLLFVSAALVGELAAIEETESEELLVRFYDTPIGVIDPRQKRLRRLSVAARGDTQTPTHLSPIHPV